MDDGLYDDGMMDAGRVLSVPQFKQRVAQILNVWSVPKTGETHSFLQKLVRGMPKRLAKCQQRRAGARRQIWKH